MDCLYFPTENHNFKMCSSHIFEQIFWCLSLSLHLCYTNHTMDIQFHMLLYSSLHSNIFCLFDSVQFLFGYKTWNYSWRFCSVLFLHWHSQKLEEVEFAYRYLMWIFCSWNEICNKPTKYASSLVWCCEVSISSLSGLLSSGFGGNFQMQPFSRGLRKFCTYYISYIITIGSTIVDPVSNLLHHFLQRCLESDSIA